MGFEVASGRTALRGVVARAVAAIASLVRPPPDRRVEDRAALLDAVPAMLSFWDTELRNRLANRAYVEWFGLTPAQIEGMHARDVLGPALFAQNEGPMRAALAGASPTFERRITDAAGAARDIQVSYRPATRDGRIEGFYVVAIDITDRKRETDSQLRKAEDRVRQAQKMEAIGRVAGGIAHDFNNLLAVIQSCAEECREEVPPGNPHRENLDEILLATSQASDLVARLLAFSRREQIAATDVDVGAVLRGMPKLLERLLGDDVRLRVDAAPSLGTVRIDRGGLEQIVMNLAINARDAMPEGGELAIVARSAELDGSGVGLGAGAYVELAVTDTGAGMTPDTLERIFEPFFTTKAVGKGTGLGLSTVFGLVKQSCGTIEVASNPGKGTTFRVLLPRASHT